MNRSARRFLAGEQSVGITFEDIGEALHGIGGFGEFTESLAGAFAQALLRVNETARWR